VETRFDTDGEERRGLELFSSQYSRPQLFFMLVLLLQITKCFIMSLLYEKVNPPERQWGKLTGCYGGSRAGVAWT
jgi:hypothetical protein